MEDKEAGFWNDIHQWKPRAKEMCVDTITYAGKKQKDWKELWPPVFRKTCKRVQ